MAGEGQKSTAASARVSQRSINSFFAPRKAKLLEITRAAPIEPDVGAAGANISSELPILTSAGKHNVMKDSKVASVLHEEPLQNSPPTATIVTPLRSSPRKRKSAEAHKVGEEASVPHLNEQLKIYWPADGEWYQGVVKKYEPSTGKHTILYDDETVEELILADEQIEWLDGPLRGANVKSKAKLIDSPLVGGRDRKRGQRKVTYLSEDDDMSMGSKNADFAVDAEREAAGDNSDDSNADWDNEEAGSVRGIGVGRKKQSQQMSQKKRRKFAKPVNPQYNVIEDAKKGPVPEPSPPTAGAGSFPYKRTLDANVLRTSIEAETLNESGEKPSPIVGLPELYGEASARFGNRVATLFDFLLPEKRRDANGKRPGSDGYNPNTVLLAKDFLKKLSPGQRQWWEFKSHNLDKVLLFKMGKFYEMFEMDAHVGVQELNLIYMKGDQPHAGFPEKGFSQNAETLARKGYRVLVIEQVETPAQMAQRNKETGTKDSVVRREVVSLLTKGTLVEADMLASHPEASFLLSLTELAPSSSQGAGLTNGSAIVGVCAVDTATSTFLMGQFVDDAHRGRLRSVLAELRPVELIKPTAGLDPATERALKDHTRQPLINTLVPEEEFWTSERTISELHKHFGPLDSSAGSSWPPYLGRLARSAEDGAAAVSALGGAVFYLRQALLESDVLALGRIEALPGSADACLEAQTRGEEGRDGYMVLDSAALENLEILENNRDGGVSGTLLASLDHCTTAVGRRMLRTWLCRPLQSVTAITARQQAVHELKQGPGADALGRAKRTLAGLPDLERLLARLHAVGSGSGRHADKVVLYEDDAKKQLGEFIAILRGCKAVVSAIEGFQGCREQLTSPLLQRLVTLGELFPREVGPALQHFEEAFDWAQAEKQGRIVPTGAGDDKLDAAAERITSIEGQLDEYLEKQKKKLGCRTITYVNVNKDRYLLEMPEKTKVPVEFERGSGKKGVQRYHTPVIKALLLELTEAEQAKEDALKGIFRELLQRFCRDHSAWTAAIKAIAQLDALSSLAGASISADTPMCRPTFTRDPLRSRAPSAASEQTSEGPQPQWLSAKGLRHPCLHSGATIASGGSFVPNDTCLGEAAGAPPFMLLTGPNMGGKSTLLRQVCLAVVLAQIGADVPAQAFTLSPVDRIFVRMGARDHIMSGQSTFFVELSETAAMLRSATSRSLVALDELGRGTATTDGAAIACAVLDHLAHRVGCRGMFSTHYHRLADEHAHDAAVQLRHMACKVGKASSGGVEEVTFLYQLAAGACPKSYGTNVAKLAGMPDAVLARAAAKSAEMEKTSDDLTAGSAKNPSGEREPPLGALEKELLDRMLTALKRNTSDHASQALIQAWREARKASVESPPLLKRRRVDQPAVERPAEVA